MRVGVGIVQPGLSITIQTYEYSTVSESDALRKQVKSLSQGGVILRNLITIVLDTIGYCSGYHWILHTVYASWLNYQLLHCAKNKNNKKKQQKTRPCKMVNNGVSYCAPNYDKYEQVRDRFSYTVHVASLG